MFNTPGVNKVQFSIGTYPQNRWSNIETVNVSAKQVTPTINVRPTIITHADGSRSIDYASMSSVEGIAEGTAIRVAVSSKPGSYSEFNTVFVGPNNTLVANTTTKTKPSNYAIGYDAGELTFRMNTLSGTKITNVSPKVTFEGLTAPSLTTIPVQTKLEDGRVLVDVADAKVTNYTQPGRAFTVYGQTNGKVFASGTIGTLNAGGSVKFSTKNNRSTSIIEVPATTGSVLLQVKVTLDNGNAMFVTVPVIQ